MKKLLQKWKNQRKKLPSAKNQLLDWQVKIFVFIAKESLGKPSALFLVGSAPEGSVLDNGKTILRPHHSPFFTIDERSLLIGSSVWV